jgi:cobalt-zinc-cadmium efflux system protein
MSHDHSPGSFNRAFAVGVALNTIFVIVEASYGLLADSVALLADAGHNLSDVAGLLLAWGGAALASRAPTHNRTYGFRRVSIFAALTSGCILLVAVGVITWESIGRIISPQPIHGFTVVVVAAIGVVINSFSALMFMSGRHHDLNIRGAFLHLAADAGVSLGVVLAGLGILFFDLLWLDPLISLGIAAVIFASTWGLLRESLNLSLDAVPAHIDPHAINAFLEGCDDVDAVHDVHIWAISTKEVALTAHLVMSKSAGDQFLAYVCAELESRFGIHHSTLQMESPDYAAICMQATPDSI